MYTNNYYYDTDGKFVDREVVNKGIKYVIIFYFGINNFSEVVNTLILVSLLIFYVLLI